MPTDPPPVYATARGPLARLASPLAARARERRHAQFFALTGVQPGARVLDVGCGPLGLRGLEPELDVTGVDRLPQPGYPGPFVQADPAEGLPFADGEFDLAYCNSVIEHVAPERRAAFAAELRRVARGWYVQTPAWSFPIEPHALLPAAHWLPVRVRKGYWRLGAAGGWEDISLLRKSELEGLFGGVVLGERWGRAVKELDLREEDRTMFGLTREGVVVSKCERRGASRITMLRCRYVKGADDADG